MGSSLLAKYVRESTKAKSVTEELNYGFFKYMVDNAETRAPRAGMFSPSSLSNSCLRHLYYKFMGIQEEPENRLVTDYGPIRSILQNGNDRHERIQEVLSTFDGKNSKFEWIDVIEYLKEFNPPNTEVIERNGFEVKLYNSVIPSRFMCDGIVKFNGEYYVIEIKTMNERKFAMAKKAGEPLEEHINQASTYSLILGINKVLYIYENRNNMQWLPLLYNVTPENKQLVIDLTNAIKTYATLNKIPPRTSDVAKNCRWCRYKILCGSDGFTPSIFNKPEVPNE